MILADTSVWVGHLRVRTPALARALELGQILCHPHVIGELACGNLRKRGGVLQLLEDLPAAAVATEGEVLACIEQNRLFGRGLGWTDTHLIASALLTHCALWTLDGALAREAQRCGIAVTSRS